jgi:hypothetical protein
VSRGQSGVGDGSGEIEKRLEVATNVAVLLVAAVVLATFARAYFGSRPAPQLQTGFERGQTFAQVPGVSYGNSPQTLLIAMSTRCHFCAESLPFYKRLAEAQRADGRATHVVAVFPNQEAEVRRYAKENNLELEAIAGVDLGTLNISGTPTAVLIDSGGKVRDFWVGKLPADKEQQIIKSVSGPTD